MGTIRVCTKESTAVGAAFRTNKNKKSISGHIRFYHNMLQPGRYLERNTEGKKAFGHSMQVLPIQG
jgi:hypothetical protein